MRITADVISKGVHAGFFAQLDEEMQDAFISHLQRIEDLNELKSRVSQLDDLRLQAFQYQNAINEAIKAIEGGQGVDINIDVLTDESKNFNGVKVTFGKSAPAAQTTLNLDGAVAATSHTSTRTKGDSVKIPAGTVLKNPVTGETWTAGSRGNRKAWVTAFGEDWHLHEVKPAPNGDGDQAGDQAGEEGNGDTAPTAEEEGKGKGKGKK